jgi:VRR-NUC domain-containing protein
VGRGNERELQTAVIECAQLLGYHVAHFRPARVMRGGREIYETPVDADGKGFPDLVLVHPGGGHLVRELKSAVGRVSPEQAVWLELFKRAGVDTGVWRPADWLSGAIEVELRHTNGRPPPDL